MGRIAATAFCLLLGLTACARYEVTRVYGGHVRTERFIDEVAYREFLRAAELEARGEWRAAALAYRAALAEDPESVEAWVQLGLVTCRMGADPARSFSAAEQLDAAYAPLWSARGACARVLGRRDPNAIERAFLLDPDDEVLALAQASSLLEQGAREPAARLLRDLAVRRPASLRVWRAVLDCAILTKALAWQRTASLRLAELDAASRSTPSTVIEDIETALVAGTPELAVARARAARVGTAELVALAIAVGQPALALVMAERVVAADPAATDMRLLGALAADLAKAPLRFDSLMNGADAPQPELLGELGRAALSELVLRHGGVNLSDAVPGPSPTERDTATHLVRARLRLRGQASSAVRQPLDSFESRAK